MKTEDILRDLIALRTDGTGSNKQCVDYICNLLEQHNILFKRLPNPDGIKENIIAGVNVQRLKNVDTGLILSGHMDTVGVNQKDWDTNPFKASDINGSIYGRGAVDMKYFIAVTLSLLPKFKETGLPIFLLFSCDEETEVQGIRVLTSFLEVRNICPRFALVGEPTHFDICTANKGYMGYTTIVKGLSAHSSSPNLGCNAAYIAAKIISKIEDLNRQYAKTGTTLNVGVVSGGEGRNSIPSEVTLDWEIRYFEQAHKAQILQQLEDIRTQLRQSYPQAYISVHEKENLPLFEERKDSKISEIIGKILKTKTMTMPHATEAGFLQQLGIDTVICGAGDERLAHTSSEHIEKTDMLKYGDFLLSLIQEISRELYL